MTQLYQDDDLVYVDPDARTVVGKVEMGKNDQPKSLLFQQKEGEKKSWRTYYPWGTYKSMKGAFRLEGKRTEENLGRTLDDTLPLLLSDSL
jgi:hypothetical protein